MDVKTTYSSQRYPKVEYVDLGGDELPTTGHVQAYGILLHCKDIIKGIRASDEAREGMDLIFLATEKKSVKILSLGQ